MVLSGVSFMQPTPLQLVTWGANLGAALARDLSPGECSPRTTFISESSTSFSTCGACGIWACSPNASSIAGRYLLVYTATGIGGSLASLWWHPLTVGAGASGAIFGLAGGLIAVLYLGKLPISKEALKPTLKSLLSFAGYNLFFGLMRGHRQSAHLGGLARVWSSAPFWPGSITAPPDVRSRRRNFAVVGTVLLLLAANSYLRQKTGRPIHPRRGPDCGLQSRKLCARPSRA